MLVAPWRIGIDIGGTFTDVVAIDTAGRIETKKSPSRPDDPTAGVMTAIAALATQLSLEPRALLEGCSMLVHGATIATNTVLEGKGARVGLLTTKGFRDTLETRRGMRAEPWDHRPAFPKVLVPRRWRLPVEGRLSREGVELTPLNVSDIDEAVELLRAAEVESIAISFLHSYANGAHEQRARERLLGHWYNDQIFCSHEVSPYVGEYGRTSTVVLAAYVSRKVLPYLRSLETHLKGHGLSGPLLLVQSNGGIASVAEIAKNPACLLLSGPAAQVGALSYVARATGNEHLISLEMGGTSCDLALMERGQVQSTNRIEIAGYPALIPSVDINSVSAGGGSIARLDAGGMMTLGPDGAGSMPGPVCYGRGGTAPTNTDAHLVLGRLAPGEFAGGALHLDEGLARKALEDTFSKKAGLSAQDAALGIVELMNQTLRHAVEQVSAEKGFNVTEYALVAVGGAGALHASDVARELGCETVYIPRVAGVFCAFGMLNSDIRVDEVRAIRLPLVEASIPTLNERAGEMEDALRKRLMAYGSDGGEPYFKRYVDLRYPDQQSYLTIELKTTDVDAVLQDYETRYEALYGHVHRSSQVVITALSVSGFREYRKLDAEMLSCDPYVPEPETFRTLVLNREVGAVTAPVFDGSSLRPGASVEGPAIVNDATTTVLVGYGEELSVDSANNLVIRLNRSGKAGAQ